MPRWDTHEIIFIDYLEKKKTINGKYYTKILQRSSKEIEQKRLHLAKEKMLVHHHHKSVIERANINELKFEFLAHASYSPDLAPSDYFLIPESG